MGERTGLATTPDLNSARSGTARHAGRTTDFALEFNGKDSYVDLPTLRYDGSHPITLEATIVPFQTNDLSRR